MREKIPPVPTNWDVLYTNLNLATMIEGKGDYGVIQDAVCATRGSEIAWVGTQSSLPEDNSSLAKTVYDCEGNWMSPGLIDCHTHLVYAGNRSIEFESRLKGVSYEEIHQRGGGIQSTVNATRAASKEELLGTLESRINNFCAEGVTTIEIKSGYGLDLYNESKILETACEFNKSNKNIDIITTFLGAHALPIEYQSNRDDYIKLIINEMLPAIAENGLADSVDGFCETIGFSINEIEAVFEKAIELGFPVKLHADQLSDGNGAGLAARFNALSADHLEYTSNSGIEAMAASGTVAVLLPGAFYTLRETKLPPIDVMRSNGVPIAIATDANPGSSPIFSIQLIMNMACTLFNLTPAEALAGVTCNAARALNLDEDRGTIEEGKLADLVIWDIQHPSELAYSVGLNPCVAIVKNGRYREINNN
jgi:imidazolonepropionase